MLSGASVAARSVFPSHFSDAREGERSDRPGAVNPATDDLHGKPADPSAAAEKVQAPAKTEKPEKPDSALSRKASGEPLSEEERQQVQELKRRDSEVRAHEQAHAVAGGPYASAPSYEFTTGPDGKRYATSGEVQIDTSEEKDPEATIRKMDIVIRAALAPAEPSAQDQAVARDAQQKRAQARIELTKQREAERNERSGEGEKGEDPLKLLAARASEAYGDSSEARAAQELIGALIKAAA